MKLLPAPKKQPPSRAMAILQLLCIFTPLFAIFFVLLSQLIPALEQADFSGQKKQTETTWVLHGNSDNRKTEDSTRQYFRVHYQIDSIKYLATGDSNSFLGIAYPKPQPVISPLAADEEVNQDQQWQVLRDLEKDYYQK